MFPFILLEILSSPLQGNRQRTSYLRELVEHLPGRGLSWPTGLIEFSSVLLLCLEPPLSGHLYMTSTSFIVQLDVSFPFSICPPESEGYYCYYAFDPHSSQLERCSVLEMRQEGSFVIEGLFMQSSGHLNKHLHFPLEEENYRCSDQLHFAIFI